jgi:serine/threonine-protein kinase
MSELVFSQDGVVRAMAFDGGPVRVIGAGNAIRWLEDGYIYFRALDGNAVRVRATGGPVDTVSAIREGEASRMLSQVLPGGQGALAVVGRGMSFEAHALDLRTGESRLLVAPASIALYSDTGHLLYLSETSIMAAPFDAGAMEFVGPAVALVDGVTTFSLSSNGTLAYAAPGGTGGDETELVWVARTGDATPVEAGWTFARGTGNPGWSLSPDGTRIALRRVGPDGNLDIWLKELPGGPFRRLTFEEGEQRVPLWTPDGAFVTYFSGVGEVWRIRADGSGSPELVSAAPPGFVQGAWTPDGAALVVRTAVLLLPSGAPGGRDLMLVRPGDSAPVPLVTTSQYAEQGPSLSPDGRWLAYTSNETGTDEVFVRPFPDVGAAKVQVSSDGGIHPLWSRDGRELFYVDGARFLVSVRFETGSAFRPTSHQPLFEIPPDYSFGAGITTIDIAPDGQRFLMGRSAGVGGADPAILASRIVVVFNFDDELRRRVPR